jgi:hypothetical protein
MCVNCVWDEQLRSVTAERDSLREDLVSTKESKRTTDTTWRAERDRVERLEKELNFYQSQSVRAMADRDKVCPCRAQTVDFNWRGGWVRVIWRETEDEHTPARVCARAHTHTDTHAHTHTCALAHTCRVQTRTHRYHTPHRHPHTRT